MPSHKHEALLELFRNRTTLAPALLQSVLGVTLPRYTATRVYSADLTEVRPVERRADYVLRLDDTTPVLAIIVEMQLSRDARKPYVWPAYATSLREKLKCPVELLVVTPNKSVARWAAKPIILGNGTFTPRVIGPDDVPVIDNDEQARADPELSVLSAITHAQDPDESLAARIAMVAIRACSSLGDERSALYFDLIYHSLSEGARRALKKMLPANYQYQSDFARKYYGQGKSEGQAEGRETLRNVVTRLLCARFGPLNRAALSRIAAASSARLEAIAGRLLTAPTLDKALGKQRRNNAPRNIAKPPQRKSRRVRATRRESASAKKRA